MTTFLRLLAEEDKAEVLRAVGSGQWAEGGDPRVFEVAPESFDAVPEKPFAYWVSDSVRQTFAELDPYEIAGRLARPQGLPDPESCRRGTGTDRGTSGADRAAGRHGR